MKEIKEGGQPGRHQPNTTKRTKQDITLEETENAVPILHRSFAVPNSATGTRTRVARVRAEYPNQLDYSGVADSSDPIYMARSPIFHV